MMLCMAAVAACHEITLNPDHVVALEVANSAPMVAAGDTIRLSARALNAAGNPVAAAVVTWIVVDTGVVAFQLDPSGLVTALTQGMGRVEAVADSLRSDAITVTVIAPPSPAMERGRGPR